MKSRNSFSILALVTGLFLVFAGNARAAVSLGIDELEKTHFAVLQGKRVGLITNPSGVDSKGRSAIDVLYHGTGFQLVRLFGPEHGIYGKVGAGRSVEDTRDPHTGLRVCSLYGDTRRPTSEMLEGIDTLVYDVQDLGCRSYTFISTLGYVMDEASKRNIEVVVLDRPDPLGGIRIEGPRLDDSVKSFVGLYDIPYVYGLTPGELAQWINVKYLDKPCRLVVVAMHGWTRGMVWEDTGLKWVPTSPNIPTIGAARGYTATGFLGEIGIESGIGSPVPFQVVAGSDWDPAPLVRQFKNLHIPGVRVLPYHYVSEGGRWGGSSYSGVYLQIDPRNSGNLTAISLQAIEILEREIDGFSAFGRTTADERDMFAKVTGQANLRHQLIAGRPVSDIVRSWDAGVVRWSQERLPYLLYGNALPKTSSATGVIAASPGIAP
ncbi:MAG: DUF1343 domain-containing protein [Methylacidiphilales bacterium]|nr:DUF1343 domain-containing protein [Candidatus Methylacidiphilales bacterium]